MRAYPSFTSAAENIKTDFLNVSYVVHPRKWQAVEVSAKPEMAMRELFSVSFSVPTRDNEEIVHWQKDILPNLPFADVHFEERVSGRGSNPGEAWKIWPWGNAADAHRTEAGRFTHTYQERFWPNDLEDPNASPKGIRYRFGDYTDLLHVLKDDPLTRQAYLPIWYPEDLACSGRKPCTLGYHFLLRHDYLHLTYFIRSCDFIRHWRDDCYFSIRLLLHTLTELRKLDDSWRSIRPGMYVMHITSLHMFVNDFIQLKGERK